MTAAELASRLQGRKGSNPLDCALRFYRLGMSVIPIPRPQPGVPAGQPGDGKTPTISWKKYQAKRASEAEIHEWFATDQNVAIVTGAISGVVVVDADSREAIAWVTSRLHYTPWQTRTSRGYHLFYDHPQVSVGNRTKIQTGLLSHWPPAGALRPERGRGVDGVRQRTTANRT